MTDMENKSVGDNVMAYLQQFNERNQKRNPDRRANPLRNRNTQSKLFNSLYKKKDVDDVPAPSFRTDSNEALKVSNLLGKKAAESSVPEVNTVPIHVEDRTDKEPPAARSSLMEWNNDVRNYTGSPMIASLIPGLAATGLWWLGDRFLNPDDPFDPKNKHLLDDAEKMMIEDKNAGVPVGDAAHYLNRAVANNKKRRWRNSAIAGGVTWLLSQLAHANYKDAGTFFKSFVSYEPKDGIEKKESMFGSGISALPTDFVRDAVANNPHMTDQLKNSTLGMMAGLSQPMVTPPDLVGAAISTGASGTVGLPLGRMAIGAAADAAVSYGLGKLMGAARPDRWAIAGGLLSGLTSLANHYNYYD